MGPIVISKPAQQDDPGARRITRLQMKKRFAVGCNPARGQGDRDEGGDFDRAIELRAR